MANITKPKQVRNILSGRDKLTFQNWLAGKREVFEKTPHQDVATAATAELGFTISTGNVTGARDILGWPQLRPAKDKTEPESLESLRDRVKKLENERHLMRRQLAQLADQQGIKLIGPDAPLQPYEKAEQAELPGSAPTDKDA